MSAFLLVARPAAAVWSIVLADPATGEVAVGSATCLNNINLKQYLPVIRVGHGAGATAGVARLGDAERSPSPPFSSFPQR